MSSNRPVSSTHSQADSEDSSASYLNLNSLDESPSPIPAEFFSRNFAIDKHINLTFTSTDDESLPNQWLLNGTELSNNALTLSGAALKLYRTLEKTALVSVLKERLPTVFKGDDFKINNDKKKEEVASMRAAGFEIKALNNDGKASSVTIGFNSRSSRHFQELEKKTSQPDKKIIYLLLAALNTESDNNDRARAFLELSNNFLNKNPTLSRIFAFQALSLSTGSYPALSNDANAEDRPNILANFIRLHYKLIKRLNTHNHLLYAILQLGNNASSTEAQIQTQVQLLLHERLLSEYLPQNNTIPVTLLTDNSKKPLSSHSLNSATEFIEKEKETRTVCNDILRLVSTLEPAVASKLQPFLEPYTKLAQEHNFFQNIDLNETSEIELANQFNLFYHSAAFQKALSMMLFIKLNMDKLLKVIDAIKKGSHSNETETLLNTLIPKLITPVQRPIHFEGTLAQIKSKLTDPQAITTFNTIINRIQGFNQYGESASNTISLLADYSDPLSVSYRVFAANQQALVLHETSLEAVESAKVEVEQTKQKAHSDRQLLQSEISALTTEKNVLTEKNTALLSDIVILRGAVSTLTTEKSALSTQNAVLTNETQELKTELSEMDELGKGILKDNTNLIEERKHLEQTYNARIDELESSLARASQPAVVAIQPPQDDELIRLRAENTALKASAQAPKTSWWKKATSALAGLALATVGALSITGKIALTAVIAASAATPVGWALLGIGALALIGAGAVQAYDSYQAHKKASQVRETALVIEPPALDEVIVEPGLSSHAIIAASGLSSQPSTSSKVDNRSVASSSASYASPIARNSLSNTIANKDVDADPDNTSQPSSPK